MAPSELIELGEQAVIAVRSSIEKGAPLVQCQLLASDFYEALKRELRGASQLGFAERSVLVSAANQCHRAATASISPGAMLSELKGAVAMLQSGNRSMVSPQTKLRLLRVIEGGLSST
jgi:hypothetical protein